MHRSWESGNWRARTRDRDEWRRLLESAKTLHGL